jgi:hypothetical protein
VGFKEARATFIEALREGRVESEPREAQSEKNLLAIGEVSLDEVAHLIAQCRGHEYSTSPHHLDREITVHVFKPRRGDERWYIKGYILEPNAVFISVHRTE